MQMHMTITLNINDSLLRLVANLTGVKEQNSLSTTNPASTSRLMAMPKVQAALGKPLLGQKYRTCDAVKKESASTPPSARQSEPTADVTASSV